MIGDITPAEWAEETDPVTGRKVTRLTDGRSNSYALYYFVPSVTPDGRYLVFHSERSSEVQLYRLDMATGEIGQLTDGHTKDSGWAIWCEWHVDGIYNHLSAIHPVNGEVWYFVDDEIRATDVASFANRLVGRLPAGRMPIGQALEGVLHGIYVFPWTGPRKREPARDEILTASFLGIHRYFYGSKTGWGIEKIASGDPAAWPQSGSSDIAVGHARRKRFIAAIEPWHGHQVAIYTRPKADKPWARQVIDDSLQDGHTIVTADLNGDGADEVIAGYRGPGRSVYIYHFNGRSWYKQPLDKGGIAAAACAVADLNGDSRPDIACIGSQTTNLKWYENKQ